MSNMLLKNVLLGTQKVDIEIVGNKFGKIVPNTDEAPAQVAIFPAFYNTHNHAPMTLVRGYGDDKPLMQWLQEYIWPYEDKLTPADIHKGSDIAMREMVSTGSVFFSDMYFNIEETIDTVVKYGMRAAIGITIMETHSKVVEDQKKDFINHWSDPTGGRIQLTVAPHAIYTVGTEKLIMATDMARANGMKLHIHISETRKEIEDCLKEHGTTPVRYLDKIGLLGPDVIAAHCVHVDREEWDILAKRGVTVAHCPCSNFKLGSGRFPYELAIASGCRITLGTDGASSNNNLDMHEEMKFAALMAKAVTAREDGTLDNFGNPSLLPAPEILKWATRNGAEAFGIDGGEIAEGKLADAILVDLSDIALNPHDGGSRLVSNWVYAAGNRCIKDVICDGKFIMKDRII